MKPARSQLASILSALILPLTATAAFAQQAPSAGQDLGQISADPAQWPMPGRTYSAQRFSELDEINSANVQNLQVAWTFSVGQDRGQEAAPIVVGDTMYVVGPSPTRSSPSTPPPAI